VSSTISRHPGAGLEGLSRFRHVQDPQWGQGASRQGAGWLLVAYLVPLSAAIGLTQMFLLTERSATVRDLACISVGALAGVVTNRIIHVVRKRARTRRTP
jgi:hypothetical protein